MVKRKFTDEEYMILYNDENYTSDHQIAKTLGVDYHTCWDKRVKLGLKPITNYSKKTPEECYKKAKRRDNKYTKTNYYPKYKTTILKKKKNYFMLETIKENRRKYLHDNKLTRKEMEN